VDEFPFVVRDTVRFGDVDSAGHVNNAVYSTYLEQARLELFGFGAPFILARLAIDFRSPAFYGEEVEVLTRCARVGTRSIGLGHRVLADGRLIAEAEAVVVCFDYERRESMPVPDEWRARLEELGAPAR
jgi:acyl-CoA thioester hydrolase